MTTIVYDRRSKTMAADSQNTDTAGVTFKVAKIEHIGGGYMFGGSGHLRTITMAKEWAQKGWEGKYEPDWSYFLEDPDDRGFSCILVDPTGTRIWIIDEELVPFEPLDDFVAVGAGATYALGALAAGADAKRAVEIACQLDTNSFEPVDVYTWPEFKPQGEANAINVSEQLPVDTSTNAVRKARRPSTKRG